MLILGQQGSNLDQKRPEMGRARFFQTVNMNFPKEDHKISFYTKNQQNSMNPSEDISQNVDFGPKRGKFGPRKDPKWAGPDLSRIPKLNFLKQVHKISFYNKNQQNSTNHLEDIS